MDDNYDKLRANMDQACDPMTIAGKIAVEPLKRAYGNAAGVYNTMPNAPLGLAQALITPVAAVGAVAGFASGVIATPNTTIKANGDCAAAIGKRDSFIKSPSP
jgi:hypothetical protein